MVCLKSYFPVTLQGNWQQQPTKKLSVKLANWLFDEGSLTKRLIQHSDTFSVEVFGQEIITCSEEDACLDVREGQAVLVREVLLHCDKQPHVFARTLIPLNSLTGEQQVLAELGEQPLGQVIFNNPSLVRESIEVSEFSSGSSVGKLSSAFNPKLIEPQVLWGRRSLFYIEGKPLLVAEVFLPPALAYT